jgi:hypothetical protein
LIEKVEDREGQRRERNRWEDKIKTDAVVCGLDNSGSVNFQ